MESVQGSTLNCANTCPWDKFGENSGCPNLSHIFHKLFNVITRKYVYNYLRFLVLSNNVKLASDVSEALSELLIQASNLGFKQKFA